MIFNLTLSAPMGVPVSVSFATADISATAGSDYIATNGTVTFSPGITNQTITVAIIGNMNYEPDETFSVTISNPTNAAIDAASGTGTILNDDPIPTATIASASVVKQNVQTTNLLINVSLSASSYQTIWMNYTTLDGSALAGTDYMATNGLLAFNPGVTNQTITVPVIGNTLYESNKMFYVALSNPTNVLITPPAAETIVSLNGQPGYLNHFIFSPIVSPEDAQVPFALTVTAVDSSNNVVTTFNGFTSLSGSVTNTPSYWFDFEEGNFSQWTPLNLGSSPGPYQIVPFDVPGLGYTSLAFRLAPNSGRRTASHALSICRPASLMRYPPISLRTTRAAESTWTPGPRIFSWAASKSAPLILVFSVKSAARFFVLTWLPCLSRQRMAPINFRYALVADMLSPASGITPTTSGSVPRRWRRFGWHISQTEFGAAM
jgi:hypothetical protein